MSSEPTSTLSTIGGTWTPPPQNRDPEAYELRRRANERRTNRERSGIPRRLWTMFEDNRVTPTAAVREVEAFIREHQLFFLVLAGGLGVGKTVAACWAIEQAGYGTFLDATQLATSSWYDRDSFSRWETTGLLVIDDLGVEYLDQRGNFLMLLDGLVNTRYNNRGRTIITTNLTLTRYSERYSERVMDRIRECGRFIELKGKNLRRTGQAKP